MNVYVICPEKLVTGGPDALHQMVFYLNDVGVQAKIAYITSKKREDVVIPQPYRVYIKDFVLEKDIEDSINNIIVIAETFTRERKRFHNAQVFIWWLSVDNSLFWNFSKKIFILATLPLRWLIKHKLYKNQIKFIVQSILRKEIYSFHSESQNVSHICASYYAYNFISHKSRRKISLCIEPISKLFLNIFFNELKTISKGNRGNTILYNPKKGYTHIINKINKLVPELKFEPLESLTQQQLIDKYKTSKLYIDFGTFPGAERIPKEAVLFGCAIITGKRGASGFYEDVPIPEEYKFGSPEKQIKDIAEKIKFVLNNYEQVYSDFDEYRNTVLNLEGNFIKSLKEIFLQQE